MLHYGNPPAHSTHFTREFLTKHNIPLVLHTHFLLLDLEPYDFSLLIKFKSVRNNKRFREMPEIVQNAIQELKNILKEQYQKCFNMLQDLEGQSKQFQNSFHLSWVHTEEKIKTSITSEPCCDFPALGSLVTSASHRRFSVNSSSGTFYVTCFRVT
jgi:hypothetical protein